MSSGMDAPTIWIPYCGAAPVPAELIGRWNFDPLLLLCLGAIAVTWWRWGSANSQQRRMLIGAAALIAILFVSPFCALTSALFSARAVHHIALTALVAPLLALALPVRPVPGGWGLWTGVHAATFWLWHAPPAYEAALSNDALYWIMQLSLLLTALALWRAVRAAPVTGGIAALLATMVQMGLLGALLTFSTTALYAPHFLGPIAWGFSPLEDQQLAGLMMWAPGAGLYLAAALALLGRWFAREQAATA